jgi:hypothetical protein
VIHGRLLIKYHAFQDLCVTYVDDRGDQDGAAVTAAARGGEWAGGACHNARMTVGMYRGGACGHLP